MGLLRLREISCAASRRGEVLGQGPAERRRGADTLEGLRATRRRQVVGEGSSKSSSRSRTRLGLGLGPAGRGQVVRESTTERRGCADAARWAVAAGRGQVIRESAAERSGRAGSRRAGVRRLGASRRREVLWNPAAKGPRPCSRLGRRRSGRPHALAGRCPLSPWRREVLGQTAAKGRRCSRAGPWPAARRREVIRESAAKSRRCAGSTRRLRPARSWKVVREGAAKGPGRARPRHALR